MLKSRTTTQRNRAPVKNFRFLTMFGMTYEWKPETMKTSTMNRLSHLNDMTSNMLNFSRLAGVKTSHPAPKGTILTKPTPGINFRRPAGQDPPACLRRIHHPTYPQARRVFKNAGQEPRQPAGVKTSFLAPTGADLNQVLKYARR